MNNQPDTVTIALHEYNRLRIINEQVLKGQIVILTSLSLMPEEYGLHYSNHKKAFTTNEALQLQSAEIESLEGVISTRNNDNSDLRRVIMKLEHEIADLKKPESADKIISPVTSIMRSELRAKISAINHWNLVTEKRKLLDLLK
jgi:hypothetical protein